MILHTIKYKLLTPTAKAPLIAYDGLSNTMGIDVFTDKDVTLRAILDDTDLGNCKYETDNIGVSRRKTTDCECHPHRSILPYANISTGIALDLPPNVHVSWGGRSGLAMKNGRIAFEGKIDSNYRGEIIVKLWSMNPEDNKFFIPAGTKIAQLVVIEYNNQYQLEETDILSPSDRGTNGFGSTGS